jgi:hypothetical protein
MQRLLRIAVVSAVVAATASAAIAAPAHEQRSGAWEDCGAKALTFLFWPQGHNAIPSINFPSYPYPHMEVYKTAAGTFPDPNEIAVIEFTPSGQTVGGFAKSCTLKRAKLVDSRPAKGKTSQTTELTCRFPKVVQLSYRKYTAPIAIALNATLRSKSNSAPLEVRAFITGAGAVLRYNPKYCQAQAPPQQ